MLPLCNLFQEAIRRSVHSRQGMSRTSVFHLYMNDIVFVLGYQVALILFAFVLCYLCKTFNPDA